MGDHEAFQCAEEGCCMPPAFNFLCGHEARFCDVHKKTGMINVHNKECAHEGCTRTPTHHRPGDTALYCRQHKTDKMAGNQHVMCVQPSCISHADFAHDGDEYPSFCGQHREYGMTQVGSRHCPAPSCMSKPRYNHPGVEMPMYCEPHKLPGMVKLTPTGSGRPAAGRKRKS